MQELAEILNLNVNTVKVRLFRARARLVDVYRRQMRPANLSGKRMAAGKREE
ncbi:MAG: sigma factor-like helix-turn-helix DNA-binding protein [Candidatus Binataceae bacterium]